MHRSLVLAPPAPLRAWRPELPPGDLRSISLHWTAGDYATVFPAYHFCVSGAYDIMVHHTHDLRENMRDVGAEPPLPYAPHTRGRNAWSIGISIAAMRDATPSDFGRFPLTEQQLEGMCRVAAVLASFYAIEPQGIRTHAEAGLLDGYFGDGDDQRWDIARLHPSEKPLTPAEATATGDWFRRRITELIAAGSG